MEHDQSNKEELSIEICVGFEVKDFLQFVPQFSYLQGELSKLREQNKYRIEWIGGTVHMALYSLYCVDIML